jgi:hypothetical protein
MWMEHLDIPPASVSAAFPVALVLPAVAPSIVPVVFRRDAQSLWWWRSIGTLKAAADIKRGSLAWTHDHFGLNNQLPVPRTIMGGEREEGVVLVRLRAIGGGGLDVCADESLEFAFEKRGKLSSKSTLRLRVVEIYYGFADYLHSISDGQTQRHSMSENNAYAICRIMNIPADPFPTTKSVL